MPDNTDEQQAPAHLFKPGQSGNPAGRPRGALNKTTRAVKALLDGEAEDITRKAIERAKEGDSVALRLCMERIYPAPKDSPVDIRLPPMKTAADAVAAMGAITEGLADGTLTLMQGQALAGIVETFRRTLETEDIAKRLDEMEAREDR